jgi:hypothetical protein
MVVRKAIVPRRVAKTQRDICARFCKRQGDRPPEPTRRPGHQSRASTQIEPFRAHPAQHDEF